MVKDIKVGALRDAHNPSNTVTYADILKIMWEMLWEKCDLLCLQTFCLLGIRICRRYSVVKQNKYVYILLILVNTLLQVPI